MDGTWDPNHQVQAALQRIVSEKGPSILSKPQLGDSAFAAIVSDQFTQVPEKTRELLRQAVEAGVADELAQGLRSGLDPESAVRVASDWLVRTTPNDAGGCSWVVGEVAQALGYTDPNVGPGAQQSVPAVQPTVVPVVGGRDVPGPTVAPDPAVTQGVVRQPTQPGGPTGTGPMPPAGPSSPTGGGRSPRNPIIAVAVAVIVAVVAIVALTHKSASSSTSTTTTTTKPSGPTGPSGTTGTSTTTTTTPPTTASVLLDQLLPTDVTPSQCTSIASPNGFQGVVTGVNCQPSTLTGGQLYAYQFDTETDYQTSFNAFNADVSFNSQGGDCQTSNDAGTGTWSNTLYPSTGGQIIECYLIDSNGTRPVLVWTIPTQDAFVQVVGNSGAAISDVHSWWSSSAGPNK